MYNSCEACGEQSTWHPQLHLVTPVSSGCVDEELAPLLEACADLRLPVLRSCQDRLHSGRVALVLASTGDAQRLLDEVVRAAPVGLRSRLLEAACPPRVEQDEWAVEASVRPSFSATPRVVSVEVQIEFPRTDLDTVVGCLTGRLRKEMSLTLAMEEQPSEVDLVAVLQSLIKDVVVIADEEAYAVLQLDELSEEAARVLVGPELFDTPSPGFYPGLRTLRPRLTTWLALRATVTALDLWDVDEDEGDLEMHLDGARLAYRWCARSYRQLTGDELDDRQDIEDWTPMSRSGHPRQPRPSYHGRGVGRLLDTETSSPRELDENVVIDLLVRGALAALDHEDQLLLMAEVGEYPRGDSRRQDDHDEDDRDLRPQPAWADVSDAQGDDRLEVTARGVTATVSVGNLRVLMEAARDLCGLPGGVPYACAVGHSLSGRPSRISFVPCGDDWQQIPAADLRPGDLLHEDVDYPYVVGQIVLSDDGQEVAVERSGRGWVNVAADELMRAQRT